MTKLSKLRKNHHDTGNWQLSLADMMTLLLCFFVILLSVSQFDPSRFEEVAQSMEKAMQKKKGQTTPTPQPQVKVTPTPIPVIQATNQFRAPISSKERMKSLPELKNELSRKLVSQKDVVEIHARRNVVAIDLRGSAFFNSASADLAKPAVNILKNIANSLVGLPYIITVEGHTDDAPITSWIYPSNWELSAARASRVARFLIESGIPKNHIKVLGLADTVPLVPNLDTNGVPIMENRARNRRVSILVSPQSVSQ
ncbi:OmpA/MotB family protein [Desulfovibrio inopinatus]|uniref:OmpA/MotB family protein n=1 Tax=Desulfovibrio inopinatus TaxID=102109 RepID=UPI0004175C86|nr:OmpA family protein [Desulfovibrio inopinatus]